MSIAENLTELRDFLVPENGPDKLVKNWFNGEEYDGDSLEPARFCILGGLHHLMKESKLDIQEWDAAKSYVTKFGNNWTIWKIFPNRFWFHMNHSAKEVRWFLNDAIVRATKEGV